MNINKEIRGTMEIFASCSPTDIGHSLIGLLIWQTLKVTKGE